MTNKSLRYHERWDRDSDESGMRQPAHRALQETRIGSLGTSGLTRRAGEDRAHTGAVIVLSGTILIATSLSRIAHLIGSLETDEAALIIADLPPDRRGADGTARK